MGRLSAVVLVLMFLVIMSTGNVQLGEARTCESQSHHFKGACLSDTNCASVCKTERGGFSGGNCRGLRRRCFCTRPC